MRLVLAICVIASLLGGMTADPSNGDILESTKAVEDITLSTDPSLPFWREARSVYAERSPSGELRRRYRTEIRSRWTENNLYFLFICPYEDLNLKPSPTVLAETFGLWNWDVAEVFIGSDFQNIRRYKEFEVSPQGEWIDLDIDLTKPHHENGWTWNSGFTVAARIDAVHKTWYGAMRIPFSALQNRPPAKNEVFRANLFLSEGLPPCLIQQTWQPTLSNTFHVPEKFGLLRLVDDTH